jgi:hypothetical protein
MPGRLTIAQHWAKPATYPRDEERTAVKGVICSGPPDIGRPSAADDDVHANGWCLS